MRPAAPFGARPILLLSLLLLAAPLCATPANPSHLDAHMCLYRIRDQLFKLYTANGNKLDHEYTIAELVAPEYLKSEYFGPDNFSIYYPPDRKDVVVLSCTSVFEYDIYPQTTELEVDLKTRTHRYTKDFWDPFFRVLLPKAVGGLGLLLVVFVPAFSREMAARRRRSGKQLGRASMLAFAMGILMLLGGLTSLFAMEVLHHYRYRFFALCVPYGFFLMELSGRLHNPGRTNWMVLNMLLALLAAGIVAMDVPADYWIRSDFNTSIAFVLSISLPALVAIRFRQVRALSEANQK
jgi:hypothetical protein